MLPKGKIVLLLVFYYISLWITDLMMMILRSLDDHLYIYYLIRILYG